MHPYLIQAVAEERIADLHRAAAAQRRHRRSAPRRSRTGSLSGWFAARARPATTAPACCPA